MWKMVTKTIACGQCGLVQSIGSNRHTTVWEEGFELEGPRIMVQPQGVQMAESGEPSRVPTWAQLTSKINPKFPRIKTFYISVKWTGLVLGSH